MRGNDNWLIRPKNLLPAIAWLHKPIKATLLLLFGRFVPPDWAWWGWPAKVAYTAITIGSTIGAVLLSKSLYALIMGY